jgi:hypothetical protein
VSKDTLLKCEELSSSVLNLSNEQQEKDKTTAAQTNIGRFGLFNKKKL